MATVEGNINRRVWSDLKSWFGRSLRVLLPMACSVALLWWLFSKVNVHEVATAICHGVNYWWLILMLVVNFLSYIVRGTRWGLQLSGVGIDVKLPTLWVSIFGAYSLNLLFTGFGETWRCLFIAHHKRAPISVVVGTDIGDRMTDLFAVLFILLLTFIFADGSIHQFIKHYSIGREADHLFSNPWVWVLSVAGATILWALGHLFKRFRIVDLIDQCCNNIWTGLKVIFTMKHKGKYLMLTLALWICYFLQTYLCFFAFPFTHDLISAQLCYGLLPGLVALLFGSLSMAIPSSGGLGPWNIAIIFSLTIYGINQTDATAFAMLAWGLEAILQVCLGIYSAVYASRLPVTPQNNIGQDKRPVQ